MKIELKLVLETSNKAYETLDFIKRAGFNATVMSSESLRHAVDYSPSDHHFINLRHLEEKEYMESVFCIFIADDNHLEELKNVIRECTGNFINIKGFMYSRIIEDFEGSIK